MTLSASVTKLSALAKSTAIEARFVLYLFALSCQLCQPLGRKGFCIRKYFIYQ